MNEQAGSYFGVSRWNEIKKVLGWRGNFISGYWLYIKVWFEPAFGKYSVSPNDVDSKIKWLVDNKYIKPSRFAIDPERKPFVGLIGYNSSYLSKLSESPISGHYVDWDYEVLFDVDKSPPTWDTDSKPSPFEIETERRKKEKLMTQLASELKRSTGKGQVIHTSLKEMESVISDFPSSNPTPGVLARAVYHQGSQRVVVELYHESPLIISPGKGDFIDCDPETVDAKVRELIFKIAERCQTQGEELINHAQRLLEIASKENILDKIDEEKVKSKAVYTGSTTGLSSLSSDISVVSAVSTKGKREKPKSNRVKNEDLLSMLADDEDEEGIETETEDETGEEEQEDEQDEQDNLLDCLLEED